MIYAFKSARRGAAGVLCLSVVLSVLIWQRDKGYPLFVPIIATTLMLALGIVVARILGNLLSSSANTRLLGYLHMELDPVKFLESYRRIPDKVRGENTAAICRSYLADGYGANGEYEQAISLLKGNAPEGNFPVQGLYKANLAGFSLAAGDTGAAREALAELEQIIDGCRLKKPELAKNLSEMQFLHSQHLACLEGRPVDTRELESAFARAQFNLRRLEIAKVLAMTAIRDGEEAAKQKHLSYLRKNGGKTIYKRWADRQ